MTRGDRPDAKLARDRRVRIVAALCGVPLFALGVFLEGTGPSSILGSALIFLGGGVPGYLFLRWWIYREK